MDPTRNNALIDEQCQPSARNEKEEILMASFVILCNEIWAEVKRYPAG